MANKPEQHQKVIDTLQSETDHFFCVSIKDGEIFHDISVEGFTNKVAMIESIEEYLEQLKQS